jgi:hypothetical protein
MHQVVETLRLGHFLLPKVAEAETHGHTFSLVLLAEVEVVRVEILRICRQEELQLSLLSQETLAHLDMDLLEEMVEMPRVTLEVAAEAVLVAQVRQQEDKALEIILEVEALEETVA